MSKEKTRIEHDTFGPIEVPAATLWGGQTQRSLVHFDISSETLPLDFIKALATVKKAAALVNLDLKLLDPHKAEAVVSAADEVLDSQHNNELL